MDLDGQQSPQPQRSLLQSWMCVLCSTLPSLTKTKTKRPHKLKTWTECLFYIFPNKIFTNVLQCNALQCWFSEGEHAFSKAFAWLTNPSQRGLNFDNFLWTRPCTFPKTMILWVRRMQMTRVARHPHANGILRRKWLAWRPTRLDETDAILMRES